MQDNILLAGPTPSRLLVGSLLLPSTLLLRLRGTVSRLWPVSASPTFACAPRRSHTAIFLGAEKKRLWRSNGSLDFFAANWVHSALSPGFSPIRLRGLQRIILYISPLCFHPFHASLRSGMCVGFSRRTWSVEKRVTFLPQAKGDLPRPRRLLYVSQFLHHQCRSECSDLAEGLPECSSKGLTLFWTHMIVFRTCISLADMESSWRTLALEEAVA